ncbi:MAG: hypothetical protein AAGI46_15965 [Planctomycetota bacterium]
MSCSKPLIAFLLALLAAAWLSAPVAAQDASAVEPAVDAEVGKTLLDRLAGTWNLTATRASGETITGRNTYTPTLAGNALHVTTFVTNPDGTTYQRYDRLMWFDAATGHVRTVGLNNDLDVREQTFSIFGKDSFRRGFDDPSSRSRETYAFESTTTITWQVEIPTDDGWTVAVSGVWEKE